MSETRLHKTQVSILHSLRYSPRVRFSALMKPTGHMSDTFKFHLQKLVKLGHVEKMTSGEYRLTPTGKLYANALDEAKGAEKEQPKLSVFLVIPRKNKTGGTEYLLFKRARNPFMGYWAAMTDMLRRGETIEEAAGRVLVKHTGLRGEFNLASFARIRNFTEDSNTLLEDMLFAVVTAENLTGSLHNDYPGGKNAWMSMDLLLAQDKYFESMPELLKAADGRYSIIKHDFFHKAENF